MMEATGQKVETGARIGGLNQKFFQALPPLLSPTSFSVQVSILGGFSKIVEGKQSIFKAMASLILLPSIKSLSSTTYP